MRFRRVPVVESPAQLPTTSNGAPVPSPPVLAYAPPTRTAPTPIDLWATPEDGQRGDDISLLRALVSSLGSAVEERDASTPEEDEVCVLCSGRGYVASAPSVECSGCKSGDDREAARAAGSQDEHELEAFSGMLGDLETGRRQTLTKKQREWATASAERREVEWGDPSARNRLVPKGEHVELLVDSMARPLAPPGRKPTELPGRP